MIKKMSRIVASITLGLAFVAGSALADEKGKPKPPPDDAPMKASSDAAADVKAGTGIKKRQPVGEADTFAKGKKVWVWSSITKAKGITAKHVWKRDDKQIWEKEFTVTSGRYRTWTRRTLNKPGTYTVEVQGEGGDVLGSTTFTITE